jgi:hypothetical protein
VPPPQLQAEVHSHVMVENNASAIATQFISGVLTAAPTLAPYVRNVSRRDLHSDGRVSLIMAQPSRLTPRLGVYRDGASYVAIGWKVDVPAL